MNRLHILFTLQLAMVRVGRSLVVWVGRWTLVDGLRGTLCVRASFICEPWRVEGVRCVDQSSSPRRNNKGRKGPPATTTHTRPGQRRRNVEGEKKTQPSSFSFCGLFVQNNCLSVNNKERKQSFGPSIYKPRVCNVPVEESLVSWI